MFAGPLGICTEEDHDEWLARRERCNTLTHDAKVLGAQANADKAKHVVETLVSQYPEQIKGMGQRGVSKLANQLAPHFRMKQAAMRAHISKARELLTSR